MCFFDYVYLVSSSEQIYHLFKNWYVFPRKIFIFCNEHVTLNFPRLICMIINNSIIRQVALLTRWCLPGVNLKITLTVSRHAYPFQSKGLIDHSYKVLGQGDHISLLKITSADHGVDTVFRSRHVCTNDIMVLHSEEKSRLHPRFEFFIIFGSLHFTPSLGPFL